MDGENQHFFKCILYYFIFLPKEKCEMQKTVIRLLTKTRVEKQTKEFKVDQIFFVVLSTFPLNAFIFRSKLDIISK